MQLYEIVSIFKTKYFVHILESNPIVLFNIFFVQKNEIQPDKRKSLIYRNSLIVIIQFLRQLTVEFILTLFGLASILGAVHLFYILCIPFVHQPYIHNIHTKKRCHDTLQSTFGLHFSLNLKNILPIQIVLVDSIVNILVYFLHVRLHYCQMLVYCLLII